MGELKSKIKVKHIRDWTIKITYFAIMIIVTIFVIYPLFFVLMTSFKDNADVIKNPFAITSFHPENYIFAWTEGKVQLYFFNSALVTGLAILGQLTMVSLAAFAIGRLRFKGSAIISVLLLSSMFITGEMTTIPNFMLVRNLGLLNTLGALILPTFFGPPGMGVYLAATYVRKLPVEIEEAATIDGCSIPKQFLFVDLPLMKPILALVAIQVFQGVWSDFFWPLITVSGNQAANTLPLGLINFQSQFNSNYGVLTAGLAILTIPIVLIYSIGSKYFIEGVAAGAVKG